MNLASALIYRVLELQDFDTWASVRKHYLPSEYHPLYEVVNKHTEKFHKLPTLEELKLEVRDGTTLDKVYALESIETEAEPFVLLEYLKNEFAQREILFELDRYVESSIAFESAEEAVRHIQQIGLQLEDKIDLIPPEETMQRISLFDSEEDMQARITLGFNKDFDERFKFKRTDYIMVGGKRGAGKSVTGSNIGRHTIDVMGESALYFSVEMEAREVLQRDAAIATSIPFYKIRDKNMSVQEFEKLAKWWSKRFVDGEEAFEAYLKHRSFEKFHTAVSRHPLGEAYLDIIYDPVLTLGRINAEVDKRLAKGQKIGLIIVDYVQKVVRIPGSSINSMDWQEQIKVSTGLKTLAQVVKIPVYSPFQIDDEGRARYARGILEAPDAVFNLKAGKGDTPYMHFETVKMRSATDDETFTSGMDWGSLRIGPHSVEMPREEPKGGRKSSSSFGSEDINVKTAGVYDA